MKSGASASTSHTTSVQYANKEKATVVILSHHGVLVQELAFHASFQKHLTVRPLIREQGFMHPFLREEIDAALEEAGVLVVCPSRHSVHEHTEVFKTEQYAVAEARRKKIWLGIIIVERECAVPPYITTQQSPVMAVAMFDDGEDIRRHYPIASWANLFAVPKNQTIHPYHRKQQKREHFPANLERFGWTLAELAAHPYS